MSHRITARVLAACAMAALSLAGCSSDGDTTDPTASPSGSAGPSTITAAPRASQPAGAIAALSDVKCEFEDGAWTFTATLKNGEKSDLTYTVVAAVAKTDGGTVAGSKTFTETLEPGESTDLEAEEFVKGNDKGYACIPSATKAPATK